MKGVVVTHKGMEAVAGKEVKEIIGSDAELKPSCALFETGNLEDFCRLCYKCQSAIKVLSLFFNAEAEELDEILPTVKDVDLSKWLDNRTFAVRSMIIDNDLFDTMESERLVGEVIHEKYGAKVDLKNPDVTFFLYVISKDIYFGVDFAGFDLSKRSYRIFALADSIRASAAYGLLRIGGYKKDMKMLDPFCHSGVVSIEAAFFASGKSVHFYDKDKFAFMKFSQFEGKDWDAFFERMDKFNDKITGITASDSQQRHVKSAEKNAKIGGLNKQINFTRMDVEWLDTKFEKGSMDRIISNPPRASRLLTEKGLDKVFQELFYTADYILKPDGRVVLLVKDYRQILNHAQRHHFELKGKFTFMQGKEELNVLVFVKDVK